MANPRLIVGGLDLSPYLDPSDNETMDMINSQLLAPQFAGQPAFSEGGAYVADAVTNREWTIPLVLTSTDRPSLAALITQINNVLYRGATVEWATDPTIDSSSFFDLEAGRLDEHWQYFLQIYSTLRATLMLWTRPWAHTGTARLVASVAGTGILQFPATGILGDQYAETNLRLATALLSGSGASGFLFAWGVHRSASFTALRSAPALASITGGGTVIGASGALGSQYFAKNVGVGSNVLAAQDVYGEFGDIGGRYRLLAFVRSGVSIPSRAGLASSAMGLDVVDRLGNVLGSVAVPYSNSSTASAFGVYDLGELAVPSLPPAASPLASYPLTLRTHVPSGASIAASPIGFQIQGLVRLPIHESAGFLVASSFPFAAAGDFVEVDGVAGFSVWNTASGGASPARTVGPINWRGDAPRLPNVGSPAASGPLQVVVLDADVANFRGNDAIAVQVTARERFQFLR